MFLLALFGLLATSFMGWVILGVTALMLIWMVAMIHLEFSGGSGFKKLWPSFWFVAVPIGAVMLSGYLPDVIPGADQGFRTHLWGSITLGGALWFLGEYVLIGLAYSIFEMRVTLWRDKKGVVKRFESYLNQNVKSLLENYLLSKLGSSQAGPETGSVLLANGKTVLSTWISAAESTVKQKILGWEHVLTDVQTWKDIFNRLDNPKQLLEGADAKFKADVQAMEAALKDYAAEFKHDNFNPNTAYLELKLNTTGTLDVSIAKADLAICLANWTFWWWAYALNFVFGDMFEAIFTRLSAWISKVYGAYVKKYFADITAIKP